MVSQPKVPSSSIPHRQQLTDEVYRIVKELLLSREIAPAAPVRIDTLAERLQVSPTPVREALARLDSEGLVSRLPMVGYTAAPLLTADQFDDLFETRSLLEPAAARRAAARATGADLAVLESFLDEMTESGPGRRTAKQSRAFIDEDLSFHDTIARISGNAMLADAIRRLHSQYHLFRVVPSEDVVDIVIPEHVAIYRAIRDHDEDAAAAAALAHIENVRTRSKPFIQAD